MDLAQHLAVEQKEVPMAYSEYSLGGKFLAGWELFLFFLYTQCLKQHIYGKLVEKNKLN